MAPRTILYTGKGGVGKTSVAAATARRCAAAGRRTIVVSTDPAHSLADALGEAVGADPTAVADGLWAQQVEAQEEMERRWAGVQDWLGGILVDRGVDRISAEELTVPPGMDELFSLLQLKRHHEEDRFDVVVVDCAPTGETLRLLSFPEVARWWLEKVFPQQGALLAAARPIARTLLEMELPDEKVLGEVRRLVEELIAMHAILRDRTRASIRLVMTPDRMVVGEAMRTFTYLGLYGYLTDAVVVNRVFPDGAGEYFAGWRERQREHLDRVESAFAPVPILRAPYFAEEVVGPAMLDRLGEELFGATDPAAVLHDRIIQRLDVDDDGAELRLELPLAEKGELALKKVGLELVVRVGAQKRAIALPPSLAGRRVRGASFEDGVLCIAFDGRPERTAAPAGRR